MTAVSLPLNSVIYRVCFYHLFVAVIRKQNKGKYYATKNNTNRVLTKTDHLHLQLIAVNRTQLQQVTLVSSCHQSHYILLSSTTLVVKLTLTIKRSLPDWIALSVKPMYTHIYY